MSDLIFLPTKNIRVVADFNIRALAYVIDLIFLFFIILMPFSSIYYELVGLKIQNLSVYDALSNPEILSLIMIGYFACMAIFAFYLISFEYLLGGSIGKKMLNLTVVSKSKNLTLTQSIIRNLTKTFLFNLLAFDCFLMIFDPQKRRVLDYVANTLVVSNRKVIKKFGAVNEL
ncbi:MAG: RDD family protein [Candidatus Nanoarchaeia archaeon]|jgi:uncharacterized RDD family membrane protein YckC